jgi:hypothetical protein
MYLSSEVSFDVEDSRRLVCFQHLEYIGRFETGEISGQLTGLAAPVVGDLLLTSQDELLHTEGFEDVIVGSGVETGEPLLGTGITGKENKWRFAKIGLDPKGSNERQPVGSGQFGLREDEIGPLSACQLQSLLCIRRLDDLQIASLEVLVENAG